MSQQFCNDEAFIIVSMSGVYFKIGSLNERNFMIANISLFTLPFSFQLFGTSQPCLFWYEAFGSSIEDALPGQPKWQVSRSRSRLPWRVSGWIGQSAFGPVFFTTQRSRSLNTSGQTCPWVFWPREIWSCLPTIPRTSLPPWGSWWLLPLQNPKLGRDLSLTWTHPLG